VILNSFVDNFLEAWIDKAINLVIGLLDAFTTSILDALGCDMTTFAKYFPASETLYKVFVWLSVSLIILNWIWQLFRNFVVGIGTEAEDPIKLSIRSALFMFLAVHADDIVNIALKLGGKPYNWIVSEKINDLHFSDLGSIIGAIMTVIVSPGITKIVLVIVLFVIGWNYLRMLFEVAERYILLGALVFTAPVAFAMGASQSTGAIFKSWCRMFAGQMFLLLINAWSLRLFMSMIGAFIGNPLGV